MTMNHARAYFPSSCSRMRTTTFEPMCPVRALLEISSQGFMKKSFLKQVDRGKKVVKYFQLISGLEEAFAPYALRLGGRTWMLNQGMERQLCDFLGTWRSPVVGGIYHDLPVRDGVLGVQNYPFSRCVVIQGELNRVN